MEQAKPSAHDEPYAESPEGATNSETHLGSKPQDTAKIPNAETLEALRQAQTREGLTSYDSVEEMMADLDAA